MRKIISELLADQIWFDEINTTFIIIIIIIIIINIINIYSGSIYKYNGSSPYKNISKRINTVKIIYKICMINIRLP